MLLVTSNKLKQLLFVSYIGRVDVMEFQKSREDFEKQVGELSPGFRLLVDFSQLEFMTLDCAPELGRIMDRLGHAGVSMVVRIIPDPGKDIGVNILAAFHYQRRPRLATCKNMVEAARILEL